jgi:RimJ/RimL family protein N-acetyltransferase
MRWSWVEGPSSPSDSTSSLHRIDARHLTRNPLSGRVMQKSGMRYEGVQRGAIRKWDRFEDVALYGLLASDSRP